MTIDLPDTVVNPFAGGLLTVLVVPVSASLEVGLLALRERGVRAWTEHLPAVGQEVVLVAGVECEEAPSMDGITDAERSVLGVLDAAGIEVDVRGSGYVSAEAVRRWGAHTPS
ncbi:hypothetical protein [Kineococcus aurantiacus]|uniref:Uncharacterized protein n=1 Tax=Kineococcus aurantiacus TaxID=37633 RepID=A0A7Y9J300_9ACTN|nr:hypothetical protein [Kineococcus aurantiacus]NYD24801.1 hypothetical protein [Kineococcus aurantiacus]